MVDNRDKQKSAITRFLSECYRKLVHMRRTNVWKEVCWPWRCRCGTCTVLLELIFIIDFFICQRQLAMFEHHAPPPLWFFICLPCDFFYFYCTCIYDVITNIIIQWAKAICITSWVSVYVPQWSCTVTQICRSWGSLCSAHKTTTWPTATSLSSLSLRCRV